jgi:GNAT acetyltransferase-like protein
MTMELTAAGASARNAWRHVLPSDQNALVSQTPEWMDCICASGPYEDATRAYQGADGRQVVLPLARRRDLPAAASVANSMPFGWGTGGLVCPEGRVSSQEVAAVVADLATEHALRVGVRPSPATESVWARAVPEGVVRIPHMTQTVDISGGFDDLWKHGFASTVRSHCRKAERRGVTAERDDTGRLMEVFDALYRKSVVRWAQQQHEPLWLAQWRARRRDPQRKFAVVAERLGPACRVWVASRGGEPIAAMVVLAQGEHSTVWRGAMDKEAVTGTGANELLHRLAIEEACQSGHRFFHLGESAPSSALARNKRGFGAEEAHYTGYRFERLPLTAADRFLRRQVKRVIGFRD